jgi:NAD+ synthase (glutamine-hydrolysing)
MLIAGLQLNVVVGDIAGNVERARKAINTVKHCDLIVLSEMFTTGYPPRDLLLWSSFIEENLAAKATLVELTKGFPGALVFGYVEKTPYDGAKSLLNAVCVAQRGKVLQQRYKTTLPTYDVFSERRYFEAGAEAGILPVEITLIDGSKVPIGVVNCEEAWNAAEFWQKHEYKFDPVRLMVQRGAKHIVCINASPYRYAPGQDGEESVSAIRRRIVREHCVNNGVGFTYVNQVGANDDIVFDGNSFAMNASGAVTAHAHHCAEDAMVFSRPGSAGIKESIFTRPIEEDLLRVLVLGTHDYFVKQPFLREAWLGLSGGIDSALVAFIGQQAIGSSRLITLGMPSEFSSEGSVSDARQIAQRLGLDYLLAPIKAPHHAFRQVFDDALGQLGQFRRGSLNGRVTATPIADSGVPDQNIQARCRDLMLMIGANRFDGLLLLTGNKSESAVGYYTLYDMCGGLGVIADLYKTLVKRLCVYINTTAREEIIPWSTIHKQPSAELAANQVDSDTLPPYDWLDRILMLFIEEQKSTAQIYEELGTVGNEAKYAKETHDMGRTRNLRNDIDWTCKAVLRNQWKRDQSARGIKLTRRHFKFGWEVPIVHRAKL